jgi:SulP family sulfate permease
VELLKRLPIPPLRRYDRADLPWDGVAAGAVAFLAVPQGLAYATIAGLPPAMGLYAAAIPTIIGSLFRSSSHVVAGPTNALSLLVGGAVAVGLGGDPVKVAVTLALMVGLFQLVAGALRLGAVVDYISSPVVLGYITGAGVLIGIGQLYNLTGTSGQSGRIWITIGGWIDTLADTQMPSLWMGLGTVAVVLLLRVVNRKIPGAIVAMSVGIAANLLFDLESRGLRVVSDISAIPTGLPKITLPALGNFGELLPVAVACTVLSLVESSAVARSIAARTGQRLESSTEFVGQGLSNISAAFFGGYPVSGSLSRSALNERAGARTRLAGVITGVLMIGVLLAFGPLLNHTPIASLAGLLLIVAWDLVDRDRIKRTFRASWADRAAFTVTVVGTWVMPLDKAIYLGVGISLILFLRKARLISLPEMVVAENGQLHEVPLGAPVDEEGHHRCNAVRMLQAEGALFFGAAGELQTALDELIHDEEVQVVVLRLKRARDLDATAAAVIETAATRLQEQGRHLLLAGVGPKSRAVLEGFGTLAVVGEENVFAARPSWFQALGAATRRALELTGPDHGCEQCPLDPNGRFAPERSAPDVASLHRDPDDHAAS